MNPKHLSTSKVKARIPIKLPSLEQLKRELYHEKYKKKYRGVIKSTIYTLVVVAAVAALIATFILPVLQIRGNSMEPTIKDEEIVVLIKTSNLKRGQLCCFSYQNKLLIKRVIGVPGDTINIDDKGYVYVNNVPLDEPYVFERTLGECDVTFPVRVTDNHYFILGDHRSTSIDSRSSAVGLVDSEQIVGKIFFRVWPFKAFGSISGS
ncbi:MAG: signal peptidase I [Clostridia bacterium]|nr:signal peptidase I [Clostridia bacterium]